MRKNGFTLVEVLAIITVISLIAVIVLPNIGGSIESKKEKELNNIISMIENSGKTFFSFNSDEYKVDINKLINEEYIVNDLLNPITNEKMEGCVRKTIDKENVYQYTFGSCSIIEVPFKAELNGGTTSQSFNTEYDEGTIIELKNPTKENYEFKEWKVVKGNSILKGNKLTIGTTDTEIYAMYESWPKLEVDLNGGSDNVDYKEYYKSGSVIELEVPTKTGYIFTGWTLKSGNGIISGNKFTMGQNDAIITANFLPVVVQAIYSETDNSLMFINDIAQTKGGTYNGKVITEVYTGIESNQYEEEEIPWYIYRSVIKKVEFIDEIKPTTLANWFRGFSSCTEMNLKKLNTSNVVNMDCMFRDCSSLTTLDLSSFNTSNIKSLMETFMGMSSLTTLDLSNWNTSKVTSLTGMFIRCSSLTTLDLSHFDTRNVINMSWMFQSCSSLTSLDLSNWNTSNVTSMYGMFHGCSGLTTLDLSNWNTSNVNEMGEMFNGCSSLTTLDLSNFNTSKVTSMNWMFTSMTSLTNLNISSFNTSKVTTMANMFRNSQKLTSLDLSNFDMTNVVDMTNMFYYTGYQSKTTFSIKFGSNSNPINATNMSNMFWYAGNNSATCSIDLGDNFDTSNVRNMENMFNRACSYSTTTTLKLGSKFNTSKVTNMKGMFEKFARNNTKVTLDLSTFDTSKVTDMSMMFNGITKISKIYVSDKWNTSAVTSSTDMFKDCTSLVGGLGTTFDATYNDKTYAKIDGGTSDPGYLTSSQTYTITYNLNGGTVNGTNPTSMKHGTTASLIVPTREGYTFTGWTVSSGLLSGNNFTMAASNVTITANWKLSNTLPEFTYTGSYQIVDDNDNVITTSTGNWKIRFLTSGTLRFSDLSSAANGIDVFCVGGSGQGTTTREFGESTGKLYSGGGAGSGAGGGSGGGGSSGASGAPNTGGGGGGLNYYGGSIGSGGSGIIIIRNKR